MDRQTDDYLYKFYLFLLYHQCLYASGYSGRQNMRLFQQMVFECINDKDLCVAGAYSVPTQNHAPLKHPDRKASALISTRSQRKSLHVIASPLDDSWQTDHPCRDADGAGNDHDHRNTGFCDYLRRIDGNDHRRCTCLSHSVDAGLTRHQRGRCLSSYDSGQFAFFRH